MMAIFLSLLVGLSFCLILFSTIGLPLYMGSLYVAAGIVACLGVVRLAARRDPHKRLKQYYVLGALAGAAIGLLTNGLFATRFKFRLDAAAVAALLGGLGAVLYAIMSVATERPRKTKPDREKDARFIRKLLEVARGGQGPEG